MRSWGTAILSVATKRYFGRLGDPAKRIIVASSKYDKQSVVRQDNASAGCPPVS
jgi:hypothetical protein